MCYLYAGFSISQCRHDSLYATQAQTQAQTQEAALLCMPGEEVAEALLQDLEVLHEGWNLPVSTMYGKAFLHGI